MNQEKPRSYYSLNLTEGRIFIIFISVLIIITILVFSIAFIISSSNKRNSPVTDIDKEDLEVIEDNDYVYHNYLDNESQGESFLADNNSTDQEKEKQNQELFTKEGTDQKELQVKEKEINEDNEIVKLDNNNVLYSSKHIEEKETAKVENKPQIIKKPTNTVVQKSPETKKREIRYTVQIGSYLEKNTAEEISLFYKIQGYPAYIIEKTTGGKRFYRLRVGPFKEKEDAEKYLTSLKSSKYGKDSSIWVVYL